MKKWYRSRTLWANLIGIVVIIISTVAADPDLAQAILTAEASILALINLVLRIITKEGLEK